MPKGDVETRCTKCGETKPNSAFRFLKHSLYCRQCENVRDRKYKRVRKPYYRRVCHLKKYGLTIDVFNRLVRLQHGCCKICKRKFTQNKDAVPCVDHCHHLGHTRAILCRRCNIAEGILKTADNALALYQYMFENELFEERNSGLAIERA
jgi:hypothetical protein